MELGEMEIIYLSLHCHHQNDSCIKMCSDESHFNVSLIAASEKLWTRTASTKHNLFEEKGEPKRNRAAALLLRLTAGPNRLSLSGSLSLKLVKAG